MSATWASAASMSRGASRRAASDLTTITESVCPSRSCRSREKRSRSFSTAVRASSCRVARSSITVSDRVRIAAVTAPEMKVPYPMVHGSEALSPRQTATRLATAARPNRLSSSCRWRRMTPQANESRGKNSSQVPPYPIASPNVTTAITASSTYDTGLSRFLLSNPRNTTEM